MGDTQYTRGASREESRLRSGYPPATLNEICRVFYT